TRFVLTALRNFRLTLYRTAPIIAVRHRSRPDEARRTPILGVSSLNLGRALSRPFFCADQGVDAVPVSRRRRVPSWRDRRGSGQDSRSPPAPDGNPRPHPRTPCRSSRNPLPPAPVAAAASPRGWHGRQIGRAHV